MDNKPTVVFLAFMILSVFVVAGYLMISDPFAKMPQSQNQAMQQFANNEAFGLYIQNCAKCHGAMGEGKGPNPPVRGTRLSEAQIQQLIRTGGKKMPAFPQLSDEQLSKLSRLIKKF